MAEKNGELAENIVISKINIRPQSVLPRLFSTSINNIATDFVLIKYSNLVFITVTQCKKIGSLHSIHLNSPQLSGVYSSRGPAVFDIKCILGADTEEKTVAIRALVEKLCINEPVLLSLTIVDLSYPNISAISKTLLDNKCW